MFETLKWRYPENHWLLSNKCAHLIKYLSLIRTFIHGYCEVFNMAWHSQKIHRWFLCHCFCYYGYIFRKINWHILSGFFPFVFCICLAMVKTDVKNVLLNSIFSRTGLYFFVSDFCYICLLSASWVLLLKKKAVHCILRVYA